MEDLIINEPETKVYIRVNGSGDIIAIDGGATAANIIDVNDWIEIDSGIGDRYYLCQSHYLDKPLMDDRGVMRYKYIGGNIVGRSRIAVGNGIVEKTDAEMDAEYKARPVYIDKMALLIEAIPVDEQPIENRPGYKWEPIFNLSQMKVGWHEVVDPDYVPVNDGTDYTRPIMFSDGMSITTGLWYTDGEDVWEAIKDGVPEGGFNDREYFDII